MKYEQKLLNKNFQIFNKILTNQKSFSKLNFFKNNPQTHLQEEQKL